MKQFLNGDSKELVPIIGNPTSIERVERRVSWTDLFGYKAVYNYSLGELLTYCPLSITVDGKVYDRTIIGNKVRYRTKNNCHLTYGKKLELIDNVCDFIKDFYTRR